MPETVVEIGFQIRAIRVTDFSIHEQDAITDTSIGFGIRLQHSHIDNSDEWVVEVLVQISRSETEPPVVTLTVECHYLLVGYRQWLAQQTAQVLSAGQLPAGLSATLNSISLSTTRGILFERLANTQWKESILPIIDPMAFQEIPA